MTAGPEYFRAMQIPLIAGRVFSSDDAETSPKVAVVNETLARGFFPKGAIGRRIMLGAPRSGYPWLTIVGVVGDVKTAGLEEATLPQFYQPLTQDASPFLALAIRTTGDPLKMTRQAEAMVHSVDPERPIYDVETMEERINGTVRQPRFVGVIAGFFAGVALFLTAIGTFGVVAHATVQRTKEIGVRMALGADSPRVLRFVIGSGLRPVVVGIALGITGALALTRVLSSMLFHVKADDPATFLLAAAVLIGIGSDGLPDSGAEGYPDRSHGGPAVGIKGICRSGRFVTCHWYSQGRCPLRANHLRRVARDRRIRSGGPSPGRRCGRFHDSRKPVRTKDLPAGQTHYSKRRRCRGCFAGGFPQGIRAFGRFSWKFEILHLDRPYCGE